LFDEFRHSIGSIRVIGATFIDSSLDRDNSIIPASRVPSLLAFTVLISCVDIFLVYFLIPRRSHGIIAFFALNQTHRYTTGAPGSGITSQHDVKY